MADFREELVHWPEKGEIEAAAERMTAKGSVWGRLTIVEKRGVMVMEGWRVRPEDEGPLPT